IALQEPGLLPVDLRGNNYYARAEPQKYPWLLQILADAAGESDKAHRNLLDWQAEVSMRTSFSPPYVYGSLALDVFAASAFALDFLLKHAEDLFFRPQGILPSGSKYYTEEVVYSLPKEFAIRLLVEADVGSSRVRVVRTWYEVTDKEASFFSMLV